MTKEEEFETRSFWIQDEILAILCRVVSRRRARDWLLRAKLSTKNAAGVRIITRASIERSMPELLEMLRRIYIAEDNGKES